MIITNCNHMIMKNRFGKNLLFIYSNILHSGNRTSGSSFILSISQNEGGFHGIVFGKRTISK